MKYDFDETVSRRGTDSMKWSVADNELPMSIADMDFKAAPEIREALMKKLEHGVFGYTEVTDEWYDAYISWWRDRHNFTMEKDWLMFCTGTVAAISSTVRKLTTPNENVVVQTPVYNIFFNSIINNGCRALESPLLLENGRYEMDFEDLERKLADPQTSLMILCNPQNPGGRIWTAKELARVGELCVKYGVAVISDEIHCDLTLPGKDYVPFASVSDDCRKCGIVCIAPTKAFNIAGIQTAAICVPDPFLRHKVWRAINTDEVAEPNAFAVTAATAALAHGGAWIDELKVYLAENRRFAAEYIRDNIPSLQVVDAEATYLLWVDARNVPVGAEASGTGETKDEYLVRHIRKETGLILCAGREYGRAGEGFLRISMACPRSELKDALERLKRGMESLRSYRYIFFDLDGTLTESGEGIVNAAKYAFGKMGMDIPSDQELLSFVGPPLSASFPRYGVSPEDVPKAVSIFREYYNERGWCENRLYPGIGQMCEKLAEYGYKLIVATSKRETQAVRIIEHFGLAPFFTDVIGNDEQKGRAGKADVIKYLLEKHGIGDPKNEVVMIGDRYYDVEGAAEFGIGTIGVTYGYGTEKELVDAGAIRTAGSVAELEGLLIT